MFLQVGGVESDPFKLVFSPQSGSVESGDDVDITLLDLLVHKLLTPGACYLQMSCAPQDVYHLVAVGRPMRGKNGVLRNKIVLAHERGSIFQKQFSGEAQLNDIRTSLLSQVGRM